MAEWRVIRNTRTGEIVLPKAKVCSSFLCRLRGLQFVFNLPDTEGLLFINGRENRMEASIHMLFMFFSIGVIWLDAAGKVVDTRHAKPWRLNYTPAAAAKYFIEARPVVLGRVTIGDVLQFEEAAQ